MGEVDLIMDALADRKPHRASQVSSALRIPREKLEEAASFLASYDLVTFENGELKDTGRLSGLVEADLE